MKNIKEMPAETFPIKPSQFRQQAAKAVLGYVKKKFSTFFSEEDKEDIISEVVLRMWRAMDLYDSSKGALSTWVGTIAENVVKSMAKAKNKREAISGEITEEDEESFYEQNTFRGYEFAADRDILLEEDPCHRDSELTLFNYERLTWRPIGDEPLPSASEWEDW